MGRVTVGIAVVLAAGCSMTACSLIFTFDGYAGDGAADASGLSRDASPEHEAPRDAGSEATSLDAVADVCDGFCDNFDDRDALIGGWSGLTVMGSAIASNAFITGADYVSSPHSAHFHSPATGNTSSTLELHVLRPMSASTIAIDFDVKIVGWNQPWPDAAAGKYDVFMSFGLVDSEEHYSGGANIGPGSLSANYFVSYADGGHSQPPVFHSGADDAWHHLHWQETFDVSAGSIHATWDGAILFDLTNIQTYGTSPVPTSIDVSIGTGAVEDVPTLDHFVDNVWIR